MSVRTVRRRGKKRLVIDISYRDADGHPARYRRDSTAPTRAGALAEERRIMEMIARTGSPFPKTTAATNPKLTYAELVEEYPKDFMPAHLKVSTKRGYNEVLDEHLLPKFGRRPVRKVDGRAAHALDTELADRAKTTRNNLQIVLRSTLRFAVRQGYLAQMPEGLPKLKRTGQLVLDIPSDADVQLILAEANEQWRLPFMLMAYAGLRPNEVRGLRWRDIRLDEKGGMITVRRGISFGETHSPKAGQRDVPMAPPLRDELDDGLLHAPDSPVVCMRDGRLITQTSLNAAFRRLLKKLGLRHWSVYCLRHYAITSWLRARVPPHVVQRMAGHSSLSTTQRYTHYVEGDLERAGELLGNMLETAAVPSRPGVRSVAILPGDAHSRAEGV